MPMWCERMGMTHSSTVTPLDDAAREQMMPVQANDYPDSALDIMEGNALHRDNIEWKAVRTEASRRAISASAPTETHDAIRWALSQLKDDHSFFAPPGQ